MLFIAHQVSHIMAFASLEQYFSTKLALTTIKLTLSCSNLPNKASPDKRTTLSIRYISSHNLLFIH